MDPLKFATLFCFLFCSLCPLAFAVGLSCVLVAFLSGFLTWLTLLLVAVDLRNQNAPLEQRFQQRRWWLYPVVKFLLISEFYLCFTSPFSWLCLCLPFPLLAGCAASLLPCVLTYFHLMDLHNMELLLPLIQAWGNWVIPAVEE